jgi:hypothetical protein
MRNTLNVFAIASILSSVFIASAPVLAAGTGVSTGPAPNVGTVNSASGTDGKTTGTVEVQQIQQMLNDAEATRNANAASNGSGTAGGNSAARYQAPFASNPGTLAESAQTTALSTSTYHQ